MAIKDGEIESRRRREQIEKAKQKSNKKWSQVAVEK